MVTISKKKSVKDIIDRTVKELWGWSPHASGKLLTEQQCTSIREELSFQFRSRGMKASSVEARTAQHGGLVVEVIVDGAVVIRQYDATTAIGGES